jgi:hypothetical protein
MIVPLFFVGGVCATVGAALIKCEGGATASASVRDFEILFSERFDFQQRFQDFTGFQRRFQEILGFHGFQ